MRFVPILLAMFIACAPETTLTARLDSGTEVKLILMQQLSAGGSKEGEEVAFMVTEDVTRSGRILIPRGAIAYGRVNWSRSAGALSKITNEPARLAVTIDRTTSIDKRTVMLQATEDGEPFHFSGKNTSP